MFRLLGPVEVVTATGPVDVGPPQRRCVLAALAVDAGRPVTTETLVDRVWGEEPPPQARRALHAHLARLRKMLEQAGDAGQTTARLERRSGGYLLDTEAAHVDIHQFRLLARQAREAGREDSERLTLLREALALWRGEPLAGLAGEWAAWVRDAWRRERVDVVVAWSDAELRAGDASAVIGPLADLAAEQPLVEPVAAALMRALYETGRGAEALEVFERTRRRLADDLGTDPGPELRDLHEAILRGELERPKPLADPPPGRWGPLTPAQLPLDVPGFTGRDRELGQLDNLLKGTEEPTAVVISALSGTAGVGKTALAVHWAHRVRDAFPDGQLYANLRGFDPAGGVVSPGETVRAFLDAFGVPPQRVPPGLDAQVGLYRSLVAGRRVLVLLDNARDAEQVRPLLPGSPPALVVTTSRNQLSGLVASDGARPLSLDLLSENEAYNLLAHRLGEERVAAEPQAVQEIVTGCARLPLALAIVAARAAAHPGFPLAALAGELHDARGGLDVLAGEDAATDLRTVFSWSYRTLTSPAARLFRLLGLHPGPDVTVPAAASLAALPARTVRSLLAELRRANLVTEHLPGRYTLHDLLRAYAMELANSADPESEREAATRRMFDHYLHTGHAASHQIAPHRHPIVPPEPAPGCGPEEPADVSAALAWFTAEQAVLLAAVPRAAASGFAAHAWRLAVVLGEFLERRGHWLDLAATYRLALEAARGVGDRAGEAAVHRGLARAYTWLGHDHDAQTHYERAEALYAGLADLVGQGRTHLDHGLVFERQGRYAEALEHAQLAVDLYEAAGHRPGHALALNAVGWCHTLMGNHHRTLEYCGQALALLTEIGDRLGQTAAWDSLGYAHHHLGDHRQAVECYQRTLELCREFGDRRHEAPVLIHLGDTYEAMGALEEARAAWGRALQILTDLDHPDAESLRVRLRA